MSGTVLQVDARLTAAVHHLAFGRLDYAVLPGAMLFGWAGIGPSLACVALIGGTRSLYVALLALAVGQIFNRGIKVLLQRERPIAPAGSVPRACTVKVPGPEDPDGASFPSGDTMAGAAVGASLALTGCGSAWWLLGAYAGFARVYFWCHFVLDAVCGYAVGSLAAALVAAASGRAGGFLWWHVVVA